MKVEIFEPIVINNGEVQCWGEMSMVILEKSVLAIFVQLAILSVQLALGAVMIRLQIRKDLYGEVSLE